MKKILWLVLSIWFLFCFSLTYYIRAATDVPPRKEDKVKPVLKVEDNQEKSIDGYWFVEGKDNGKPYTAMIMISQAKPKVYVLQYWVSGKLLRAIGLREGDDLSVAWNLDDKLLGVTRYKIYKGLLEGQNVYMPGTGVINQEKLTFLRPLPTPEKEEEP